MIHATAGVILPKSQFSNRKIPFTVNLSISHCQLYFFASKTLFTWLRAKPRHKKEKKKTQQRWHKTSCSLVNFISGNVINIDACMTLHADKWQYDREEAWHLSQPITLYLLANPEIQNAWILFPKRRYKEISMLHECFAPTKNWKYVKVKPGAHYHITAFLQTRLFIDSFFSRTSIPLANQKLR